MKNIERAYQVHHKEKDRAGFAVLEKERGLLFSALIGRGKEVLDLGCRDGVLTKYFVEGNNVTGTDIDSKTLEEAQVKLGIKTLHFDLQDDEWPLGEGKFDVVVAAEILEHLYFPYRVLEKICKVLKPGGQIVGSVPNAFAFKNKLKYLFNVKRGTPLEDPMHINHFSWRELRELLQINFSSVQFWPLGKKYLGLTYLYPAALSYAIGFRAYK